MAIDYGERRIGLALSDEMRIIASGAGTCPNDGQAMTRITAMIAERNVQGIIVGLPLTLRGEHGSATEMVKKFVDQLRAAVSQPVELIDERFTSSMAEQTIRDLGVGKKKRREKGKVDEIAAVILLQGYLDANTNTAGF